MLAICWLIIALNLGYRVYVDRVAGLATGLWRSGPLARCCSSSWSRRCWRRLRVGVLDRQAARSAGDDA